MCKKRSPELFTPRQGKHTLFQRLSRLGGTRWGDCLPQPKSDQMNTPEAIKCVLRDLTRESDTAFLQPARARRTELREIHILREMLMSKGGRDFALACIENTDGIVPERITSKLVIQTPPVELVDLYLHEIAKAYSVDWAPESHAVTSAEAPEGTVPEPVGERPDPSSVSLSKGRQLLALVRKGLADVCKCSYSPPLRRRPHKQAPMQLPPTPFPLLHQTARLTRSLPSIPTCLRFLL